MIASLGIDSLAFGGNGVGRLDGKAIFVPYAAPGDRLDCRIVRDKGRWAEAEIVNVRAPAPERIVPPCPVFGRCGGCQWQFLPYPLQAQWKERIFTDLLVRQAGVAAAAILPIVPAPVSYGYRSRVQFKCINTPAGFTLGFYRRGSHYVEGISACPLAAAGINALLPQLQLTIAGSSVASAIPQIDAGIDDRGRVRLVVHTLPAAREAAAELLQPLAVKEDFALFIQSGRKDGLMHVCGEEDLVIRCDTPPLELAYAAGGFAQVNLDQNRALVAAVLAAANLRGGERLLDLYCGMGNFSLPLARRCAEVVGVEDYAPAIAQAKVNARKNGLGNTRFLARPAAGALTALSSGSGFDLVLLDPPREGAHEVCRELLASRVSRILYVSCDPATLARDLKALVQQGYRLASSRPFDFFPQTHHIESLSVLERNV